MSGFYEAQSRANISILEFTGEALDNVFRVSTVALWRRDFSIWLLRSLWELSLIETMAILSFRWLSHALKKWLRGSYAVISVWSLKYSSLSKLLSSTYLSRIIWIALCFVESVSAQFTNLWALYILCLKELKNPVLPTAIPSYVDRVPAYC